MSEADSGSRQAIHDAARELFATRMYGDVTIRDIADRAGVSPALVMKHGTSKKTLFHQVATITPPPLPDVPLAQLGAALVAQMVERHQRPEVDHLGRSLVLRLSGPDPEAIRDQLLSGFVGPLAVTLEGADAQVRAELVVAALSGLVVTLRFFAAPASGAALDTVIGQYGRAIQSLIDGEHLTPL